MAKPGSTEQFVVGPEDTGERLDRWLAARLGDAASRSQIHNWLNQGCIKSTKEPETKLRKSDLVEEGQVFELVVPEPRSANLKPHDLSLRLIYQDDDLAVVLKPPGIAVHPGPGDNKITLINGLLFLFGSLPVPKGSEESDIDAEETEETEDAQPQSTDQAPAIARPGIVHRLDRDTEGLLVVARTESAHRHLSRQFATRQVKKTYQCWVHGSPNPPANTIRSDLRRHPKERLKMRVVPKGQGREAVTHYRVLRVIHGQNGRTFANVEVHIETGRTHQIRVHLASIGHPIVGDPLYSRSAARYEKYGMLLLARAIGFAHPADERPLQFELEQPERFARFEELAPRL